MYSNPFVLPVEDFVKVLPPRKAILLCLLAVEKPIASLYWEHWCHKATAIHSNRICSKLNKSIME